MSPQIWDRRLPISRYLGKMCRGRSANSEIPDRLGFSRNTKTRIFDWAQFNFSVTQAMRDLTKDWLIDRLIDNGNWTEWSSIWFEIIRVISKSNERGARVWFEITSMISDQNCTTRSSITTLLHLCWNHSFIVNIKILFLLLHFHFDGLKKGCDLEQKMVQFGNKSHCWEPIRLQGSPAISKWVQ